MLPAGSAGSLVGSGGSAASLPGEGGPSVPDYGPAGLPRPQDRLPYTNTRLVLRSEVEDEDSYFFGGTVVRLWSSATSHPAVRGNLQGLEARCVSSSLLFAWYWCMGVNVVVLPDGFAGWGDGRRRRCREAGAAQPGWHGGAAARWRAGALPRRTHQTMLLPPLSCAMAGA